MTSTKRAFERTLKQWGHDVLLQRMLENGNHSKKMEQVTVRSVGQNGLSNTRSRSEEDEGLVTDYDAVYYMEASIDPKEGDRIYEGYSAKVGKNYSIFSIEAISPNRGRFGEILFWTVGTTREK